MKLCVMCEQEGTGPTPAMHYVAGQRWHEGRRRMIVFRGNVCEMHYVEGVANHSPHAYKSLEAEAGQ